MNKWQNKSKRIFILNIATDTVPQKMKFQHTEVTLKCNKSVLLIWEMHSSLLVSLNWRKTYYLKIRPAFWNKRKNIKQGMQTPKFCASHFILNAASNLHILSLLFIKYGKV